MIRKKRLILFLIIVLLYPCKHVLGDAFFYYPNNYNVTIKNVSKDQIKSIELIYRPAPAHRYFYSESYDNRAWIDETDFGYKYKDYKDEEIIPKLTTEEIDNIVMVEEHEDASDIKGYWIEESKLPDTSSSNGHLTKFAIYDKAKIDYRDNEIVITYNVNRKTDNDVYPHANSMYLRITKSDDSIIYSDMLFTRKYGTVDENSTNEDRAREEEYAKNTTANFEIDFSKAYIKAEEIIDYTDDTDDTDNIDNASNDKAYYNYIVCFEILILLISGLILWKYKKSNNKK